MQKGKLLEMGEIVVFLQKDFFPKHNYKTVPNHHQGIKNSNRRTGGQHFKVLNPKNIFTAKYFCTPPLDTDFLMCFQ